MSLFRVLPPSGECRGVSHHHDRSVCLRAGGSARDVPPTDLAEIPAGQVLRHSQQPLPNEALMTHYIIHHRSCCTPTLVICFCPQSACFIPGESLQPHYCPP